MYVPSGAPGGLSVKPFATDSGWTNRFGSDTAVSPGWNIVRFGWPIVDGGRGFGLQVNNGTGWTGTVLVDAVRW